MNRSLQQWVDYIQTLHCREIELTLERVREVYLRLYPQGVPFKVVSVSGTNGKGSTSELISAIYRAAGYSVGKYTSPHLISFNERVNIQGIEIGDQALLDAFERVESVREDTTLTFFEYGTLVAIDCFVTAGVDIAVMEVGLGGRLDAVNILDAAVAVVTSISIDHTSWLGDTIEKIAVEKAGIARSNRPCLIGMQNPPASLLKECHRIGAIVRQSGKDFEFDYKSGESVWGWRSTLAEYCDLPLPYGQSGVQLSNAALALQVVTEMHEELSVTQDDIYSGLASASIFGRRQVLQKDPLIILDVAHNESSVNALAEFLSTLEVKGEVIAVCGMLKDKDIARSLQLIANPVSQWHFATIEGERGSTSSELEKILHRNSSISPELLVFCHQSAVDAYDSALETLTADDCLLVFGSFFIVGDILHLLKNERQNQI